MFDLEAGSPSRKSTIGENQWLDADQPPGTRDGVLRRPGGGLSNLSGYKLVDAQDYRDRVARDRVVYFIRAGDMIKIGSTINITQRFQAIRTACPTPIELLGTLKGAVASEAMLHVAFAKHRSHGEWFHDCQDIRDFLASREANGVLAHPKIKPARKRTIPITGGAA